MVGLQSTSSIRSQSILDIWRRQTKNQMPFYMLLVLSFSTAISFILWNKSTIISILCIANAMGQGHDSHPQGPVGLKWHSVVVLTFYCHVTKFIQKKFFFICSLVCIVIALKNFHSRLTCIKAIHTLYWIWFQDLLGDEKPLSGDKDMYVSDKKKLPIA